MCDEICNVVKSSMRSVMDVLDSVKPLEEAASSDYEALLESVIKEATQRLKAHRGQAGEAYEPNALASHGLQLRSILPIQEMAYDCVEKGRYDEALLHLGMMGVYLGRLSKMPFMQLTDADLSKINESLEHECRDSVSQEMQNKCMALLNKLNAVVQS
ncbi:hypothetical protein P5704_026545 (plasmid) [Pseudomonas sp. FeN3W]|nr:hypothetical protein P5704_026545 [Pseudomonas sp. FeN3W]